MSKNFWKLPLNVRGFEEKVTEEEGEEKGEQGGEVEGTGDRK